MAEVGGVLEIEGYLVCGGKGEMQVASRPQRRISSPTGTCEIGCRQSSREFRSSR